jgi:hypothetical protein
MKIFCANKLSLQVAIVASVLLPEIAGAQFFTSTKGDLLLGFRKPGVGSYELVVNVASVTNFLAKTPGAVVPISNFTPSQLSDAFSDYNNLQWSVSAYVTGGPGSTWSGFVPGTIWFTIPRFDPSTQSSVPARASYSTQSPVVTGIQGIGNGANSVSSGLTTTNTDNNAVLVREPIGSAYNYSVFVQDPQTPSIGDFGGYLPAVENTTPPSFSSAVVSDLYQAVPTGSTDPISGKTTGAAYYVGYFTLSPDGTMTFTRASAASPTQPVLTITRAGTTSTISLATVNGATYTLYYTNSAGLTQPVSGWASSPTTISGDGTTKSFSDTTSDTDRVYRVGAH